MAELDWSSVQADVKAEVPPGPLGVYEEVHESPFPAPAVDEPRNPLPQTEPDHPWAAAIGFAIGTVDSHARALEYALNFTDQDTGGINSIEGFILADQVHHLHGQGS